MSGSVYVCMFMDVFACAWVRACVHACAVLIESASSRLPCSGFAGLHAETHA